MASQSRCFALSVFQTRHVQLNTSLCYVESEVLFSRVFRPSPDRAQVRRVVPSGDASLHAQRTRTVNAASERRLEVLRNCVTLIFENKISDVRKVGFLYFYR